MMHSGMAVFVLYVNVTPASIVFLAMFFWSAALGDYLSVHRGWVFIAAEHPFLGLGQSGSRFGAVISLCV